MINPRPSPDQNAWNSRIDGRVLSLETDLTPIRNLNLGEFKTGIESLKLGDFKSATERSLGEATNGLNAIKKWRVDQIDPWKQQMDMRIQDLSNEKLNRSEFITNDNAIKTLDRNIGILNTKLGSHTSDIKDLQEMKLNKSDYNPRSKDIDNLQSNVQSLASIVGEDGTKIKSLGDDVRLLGANQVTLGDNMKTLSANYDSHNAILQGLNNKYESHNQQINNNKGNIININTRVNDVTSFANDLKKDHDSDISKINTRLNSLEKNVNGLDSKYDELEKRVDTLDGDLSKVRVEIANNHKDLEKRLKKQDEKMEAGFSDLKNAIKDIKPPGKPKDNTPSSPGETRNKGEIWNNGGNWNKGGNFNTFIHAPNCREATFNVSGPCSCRINYPNPTGPPLYPPSDRRIIIPIQRPVEYEVIWPRRRARSPSPIRYSSSRSSRGSSAWNAAGGLSLELSRKTGGGLFSKPKADGFSLQLGGAGGAGRSRSMRRRRSLEF